MSETATETIAVARRLARQDRQSRVGILRNPNPSPTMPPRRVSLTGKWMRLRSTRRPCAQPEPPEPAPTPAAAPPIVVEGEDGVRINLAALHDTVAAIPAQPLRKAFAQQFRHDLPEPAKPPKPRPMRLDPVPEQPAPEQAAPTPAPRARPALVALGLGALCGAGAVLWLFWPG